MGINIFGRTVSRTATVDPFRVFEWANPRGESHCMAIDFSCAQTAIGTSELLRARIRWGTQEAQHEVIVDASSRLKFNLIGSACSIDIYSQQDDLLTPEALTPSAYRTAVTLAGAPQQGVMPASRLTFTSHMLQPFVGAGMWIPRGAVDVRVDSVVSGHSTSGALPDGLFHIYGGTRATAGTVRTYWLPDMREPKPIEGLPYTDYVSVPADTNIIRFSNVNAVNTETVRAVFGILV